MSMIMPDGREASDPNPGDNNANNKRIVLKLLRNDQKSIKRESKQDIELFGDQSVNIHTMTWKNTFDMKQFVMDITQLLDKDGNESSQSLIILMAASEINAYIMDKQDVKMTYFCQEYDMTQKFKMMMTLNPESGNFVVCDLVTSIVIHPNNRYIAICYDQVIKIFEIFINYNSKQSQIESMNIEFDPSKDFQLCSDGTLCKHFTQVIFFGNLQLNELILINNAHTKQILIYNFISKELLHKFDGYYDDIVYNQTTQCLTILKEDSIELYDISSSTNVKFECKLLLSFKNPESTSNNNVNKAIRIMSTSPNGRYLLTSPRIVNEQYDNDQRLEQPFDIYEINGGKLLKCYIKPHGKVRKRMKMVDDFENENEEEEEEEKLTGFDMNEIKKLAQINPENAVKKLEAMLNTEQFYDVNHFNDLVEYDSDKSERWQDSASSYEFDHISFKWIKDDTFIYIIDELNGHHFGELIIVGLDIFTLTIQHKQIISDTTKQIYDIILHNEIIDVISTFLNGFGYYKKIHIRDHGYRHKKERIVCDINNRVFGVYGWDKSFRFHVYS